MGAVVATIVMGSVASATEPPPAPPPPGPKPGTPTFTLELTIQVDGHQAVRSTVLQNDGGQMVLLPESIWKCYTRPTVITTMPIAGSPRLWGKELLCMIPDKRGAALTQAGTLALCGEGEPEGEGYMYIREGTRIFRFNLKCSMPVAPARPVLQ